jgi:hypothetical protein
LVPGEKTLKLKSTNLKCKYSKAAYLYLVN